MTDSADSDIIMTNVATLRPTAEIVTDLIQRLRSAESRGYSSDDSSSSDSSLDDSSSGDESNDDRTPSGIGGKRKKPATPKQKPSHSSTGPTQTSATKRTAKAHKPAPTAVAVGNPVDPNFSPPLSPSHPLSPSQVQEAIAASKQITNAVYDANATNAVYDANAKERAKAIAENVNVTRRRNMVDVFTQVSSIIIQAAKGGIVHVEIEDYNVDKMTCGERTFVVKERYEDSEMLIGKVVVYKLRLHEICTKKTPNTLRALTNGKAEKIGKELTEDVYAILDELEGEADESSGSESESEEIPHDAAYDSAYDPEEEAMEEIESTLGLKEALEKAKSDDVKKELGELVEQLGDDSRSLLFQFAELDLTDADSQLKWLETHLKSDDDAMEIDEDTLTLGTDVTIYGTHTPPDAASGDGKKDKSSLRIWNECFNLLATHADAPKRTPGMVTGEKPLKKWTAKGKDFKRRPKDAVKGMVVALYSRGKYYALMAEDNDQSSLWSTFDEGGYVYEFDHPDPVEYPVGLLTRLPRARSNAIVWCKRYDVQGIPLDFETGLWQSLGDAEREYDGVTDIALPSNINVSDTYAVAPNRYMAVDTNTNKATYRRGNGDNPKKWRDNIVLVSNHLLGEIIVPLRASAKMTPQALGRVASASDIRHLTSAQCILRMYDDKFLEWAYGIPMQEVGERFQLMPEPGESSEDEDDEDDDDETQEPEVDKTEFYIWVEQTGIKNLKDGDYKELEQVFNDGYALEFKNRLVTLTNDETRVSVTVELHDNALAAALSEAYEALTVEEEEEDGAEADADIGVDDSFPFDQKDKRFLKQGEAIFEFQYGNLRYIVGGEEHSIHVGESADVDLAAEEVRAKHRNRSVMTDVPLIFMTDVPLIFKQVYPTREDEDIVFERGQGWPNPLDIDMTSDENMQLPVDIFDNGNFANLHFNHDESVPAAVHATYWKLSKENVLSLVSDEAVSPDGGAGDHMKATGESTDDDDEEDEEDEGEENKQTTKTPQGPAKWLNKNGEIKKKGRLMCLRFTLDDGSTLTTESPDWDNMPWNVQDNAERQKDIGEEVERYRSHGFQFVPVNVVGDRYYIDLDTNSGIFSPASDGSLRIRLVKMESMPDTKAHAEAPTMSEPESHALMDVELISDEDRLENMLENVVEKRYKKQTWGEGLLFRTTGKSVKVRRRKNFASKTSSLRIKNVLGDGNCLFRAIAWAVKGNEEDFAEIRSCVVAQLTTADWVTNVVTQRSYLELVARHTTQFQTYIRQHAGALPPLQDQYIGLVAQNGVWGGEVEIRAAAEALGRTIVVLDAVRQQETTYNDGATGEAIELYYTGLNHYQVAYRTPVVDITPK